MPKVTESDLQELLARQKCYDVLTRYCRALDRCDVKLMKSVYWKDAMDDHGVFKGNAQEFSTFIIREIQNWFEVTTHAICNVHMEYAGDVMYTESYLLAYHRVNGKRPKVEEVLGSSYLQQFAWDDIKATHHVFFYGGRYIDRLEKRKGEWRIAHRRVVMDWNENMPGCTILNEGIHSDLQLRGSRNQKDPVFLNRPKAKK